MQAGEICRQVRENVQIFSLAPLQDGFPDDVVIRDSTRILPVVNRKYRRMIRRGMHQCWHRLTMTAGVSAYRISGDFTLVLQGFVQVPDGSTKVYPLKRTSLFQAQDIPPNHGFFINLKPGRPEHCDFSGDMVMFDRLPDQAYLAYFFADTLVQDMVNRTDVPVALDTQLHDILVSATSYDIARAALNRPDVNQGMLLRFQEIKGEYEEDMQFAQEVQTARFVNQSSGPRMNDTYRQWAVRRR